MKRKLFLASFLSLSLSLLASLEISAQTSLFTTGQDADIILGPYTNSGGASALHHPSRVCLDPSGRLIVADTRNNRVLIWNSIPTTNAASADIVVGQPDMNSNSSGGGQTGLNWPVGVYSDGTRLFVADTDNNRVLIWNSIPTTNGAPADLVLGQSNFTTYTAQPLSASSLRWPWDVYYDGTRLFVVDTSGGRVLIWNSLPTTNGQAADVVVGKPDFTSESGTGPQGSLYTPRGVASNGTALAVCDYNWHRVLIWKTIPTSNGANADIVLFQPDFTSTANDYTPMGIWMRGQKLYVACNHNIYVWNSLPTQNNQAADYIVGRSDLQPGLSAEALSAPWGVFTDGTRLAVADTNNSRVLIWNTIPTTSNVSSDVVLGQSNFTTNVFRSRRGIRSVSGVASTGHHLLLATHIDNRVVIHNGLPTADCDEADWIISDVDFDLPPNQFPAPENIYQVSQMWTDGSRLLAVELSRGILIWDRLPQASFTPPDRCIKHTQGASLNSPQGITSDGTRLFVSDTGNNRVLIWNRIPTVDGTPADLVLGQPDFNSTSPGLMSYPSRIATDGTRLAVADMEHHTILIWNTIPVQNNQAPDLRLWFGNPDPYRFNLPQGVFIADNRLYVADSGFHRVLIWNTFPTTEDDPCDIILGQPDLSTTRPQKARNRLHIPLNIWFDGDYLWVGEFKFADRVLGFRANIPAVPPSAPGSLTAAASSSYQIDLTWVDNADNEQGFMLERKTGAGGTYAQIAWLSANTRTFSDIRLTPGTQYYYRLKAYNRYGESSYSNEISATTSSVNNPPYTPSNPDPSDGQTGVNTHPQLTWQGGDPDAGDAVTYDVYFDTVSPPTYKVAENLTAASYTPPTLSMDITYYWRIVAKDLSSASTEGPIWSFHTVNLSGYNLTIAAGTGGATHPRAGTYRYEPGTTVSILAIPNTNYIFSRWTGDVPSGKETANPISLTMDSNKTITANFTSILSAYYIFDGHDFNGNGTSDISVWRPTSGMWYIKDITTQQWGTSGDTPCNGDYNGDGITDIAVWRPADGMWYLKNIGAYQWGTSGDIPVPGKYNADLITDIAVWRPSNGMWYIRNIGAYQWGAPNDLPVPGDYNGDGVTDIAVWRPDTGMWYIYGIGSYQWGTAGDIPVPADYNGDGVTDIAVWRPSNGMWYIRNIGAYQWGTSGDIPAPGKYNLDASADIAVWRPSTGMWYLYGIGAHQWGTSGDIPLVR